MSEIEEEPNQAGETQERRCPNCDSVVAPDADRCLMCGLMLPVETAAFIDKTNPSDDPDRETIPEPSHVPGEVESSSEVVLEGGDPESEEEDNGGLSVLVGDEGGSSEAAEISTEQADPFEGDDENQANIETAVVVETDSIEEVDSVEEMPPLPAVSTAVVRGGLSPTAGLVTAVVLIISFVLASLALRYPPSRRVVYAPTRTPVPPTMTFTPTASPSPTGTTPPTETPTVTLTPAPTDTPKPPRFHTVASSETLFGLGLFYGITADSIAEANGLPPNSGIQVDQNLVIPWPTATPPLVPIEVEVGGQTIIADPTDCEFYQIQGGDTLFGIASQRGVDLRAILAVNRLTDQVVLQPGDVLCIPIIIHNGVLPPTPGPSPTPTQTPPPPGPQLLYPVQNAEIGSPEGELVMQWAAVKDLAPAEWYMVEVTDLSVPDSHPMRGFTRRNAFRAPESWRPVVEESHLFRWRVAIVQVNGEREDGSFIYTFGGNSSGLGFFNWMGAIPDTPTPTASPTPSPTPEILPTPTP